MCGMPNPCCVTGRRAGHMCPWLFIWLHQYWRKRLMTRHVQRTLQFSTKRERERESNKRMQRMGGRSILSFFHELETQFSATFYPSTKLTNNKYSQLKGPRLTERKFIVCLLEKVEPRKYMCVGVRPCKLEIFMTPRDGSIH